MTAETPSPRTHHIETMPAGQTPGAGSIPLPCWCPIGHNHGA